MEAREALALRLVDEPGFAGVGLVRDEDDDALQDSFALQVNILCPVSGQVPAEIDGLAVVTRLVRRARAL